MEKTQVIGFALVSIFALSGIQAAGASAEMTLLAAWTAKGTEVTTELAITIAGTILLADTKVPLIGEVAVTCESKLDGFVSANGTGLITEILSPPGVSIGELTGTGLSCEAEKACEAGTKSPIEFWPLNLPWVTLGYLMENGILLYLILGLSLHVKCLIMDVNAEDECTAPETGILLENDTGFVLIPAGSVAEPLANCSQGGSGSGVFEVVGDTGIALTSGEALQITE